MSITANLSDQIDLMRGSLRPEEIIEVISLLLLLKHYDSNTMIQIGNMGKSSQASAIQALIEKAKVKYSEAALDSSNLINASSVLHSAIAFVVSNSDDVALCHAIRAAMTGFGRSSEHNASQNEQTLFNAMIGHAAINRFFDGTAGIATIASRVAANQLTLREINHTAYAIGCRLLAIEGKSYDYQLTNSLVNPCIEPASHDLVVMTPPFGLRLSNLYEINHAPFLLKTLSETVPSSASDSLWIQLALYALSEQGKAYLLLPSGVFFRGGYDAALREYLVENELIDAIINLPGGLLDYTMIPTVLLVLNKAKSKGSAIHFVNVRDVPIKQGRKMVLSNELAKEIAEMAEGQTPNDSRYKAVYLPEIRDNSYMLSVERYFDDENEVVKPNLADEKRKLADAELKHQQSQTKLLSLLNHHMTISLQ